eukprot:540997-Amphidinium_carterae.1
MPLLDGLIRWSGCHLDLSLVVRQVVEAGRRNSARMSPMPTSKGLGLPVIFGDLDDPQIDSCSANNTLSIMC